MKRLTLLLLLATTATCCGQSSEQILNSIGSSDMSADLVVTEPSYIDELEQLDRQSNEATQHQFDTIKREERSSATGKGQHLPSRYSTSSHTTPPAPLHDSSKNGYRKPNSNVHQSPK